MSSEANPAKIFFSPENVTKLYKTIQIYLKQNHNVDIGREYLEQLIKVMKRLNINPGIIADWDKTLRKNAIQVIPTKKINVIKEDPTDNKFLECAVESHADYIVSGDKHLKRLKEFKKIKIVTVNKFLDILRRYKEE